MTQGILNTLNLPHMEDIVDAETSIGSEARDEDEDDIDFDSVTTEALLQADRYQIDILAENGHGESMDDIHKKTLAHADDLMDLGHNVDQRSMATIFEKANMLYKTALDAKATKMDAQVKLRKLMLDERKLQLDERKLALEEMKIRHEMGDKQAGTQAGQAEVEEIEAMVVMDRNALVAKWRAEAKEEEENK